MNYNIPPVIKPLISSNTKVTSYKTKSLVREPIVLITPAEKLKTPMNRLRLGVIGLSPDEKKSVNEELMIYELIKEYLGTHAGMQDELTLWTAFKNKKPVTLKRNGEKVYIHQIDHNIEWKTNKVHTRYLIKRELDPKESEKEYDRGLEYCLEGELIAENYK